MTILNGKQTTRQPRIWSWLVAALFAVGGTASNMVQAAGFQSPQECQAYEGDAHLNCLYAFIEIQKDKLSKVDNELKAQKGALGQSRDQVDRMEERPAVSSAPATPPVYSYAPPVVGGYYGYPPAGVYAYPPIGFSFYVGPRPFYGPRYYLYHPRYFAPRIHRR